MSRTLTLGCHAVAMAAHDAGITAAYGYPGTPSTEILELLIDDAARAAGPPAAWCTNEKTAYEAALGVALAGRRSLVTMKHVGLNVAADAFVNSALVDVHGGLVLAVADDPGMHSSQNEQDSRLYAALAKVICLEPSSVQEAYDLTREAFALSERFAVPVVVRLVTRLAHGRDRLTRRPPDAAGPIRRAPRRESWILLPANARRQWRALLDRQRAFAAWADSAPINELTLADHALGIVSVGLGRAYLDECVASFATPPSRLHIGTHPQPATLVARFANHVDRIVVLEEGGAFVEPQLRALAPRRAVVEGRMTGRVPESGELDPDAVRTALGLPERPVRADEAVPVRQPRLCNGCPHLDMYAALALALGDAPARLVASDVGCYTLGALPPLRAIDTSVCMGASIGMARGAVDAGIRPVIAVIGDSTFLHSGVPALIDAVASNSDMTVVIFDNEVVGMTGGQPSILPSSRVEGLVRGIGVDPRHLHVVRAHPGDLERNASILRDEIAHPGLSVVIGVRECVEAARARRAAANREAATREVAP